MKKFFTFLFCLIELVCLAFSVRIILPITNIFTMPTGEILGSALLLPYALITLIVGFLISIILHILARVKKNNLLLFLQRFMTAGYLVITLVFVIFCVL